MAEKDIAEKILFAHNDVFADIVNGLLFDGKPVMLPEDLLDQAPRSAYKTDGKIREIERDVAKRWVRNNIRISCIGFENETRSDPDMVLRVYAYDGAEYRTQLLRKNKDKPRYPVVTLVLYFGYKRRWNAPVSLHEAIPIPDSLKEYVPNVRINLFEIAWLSKKQTELFKSDFRVVADYFVQMRENNDYNPGREKLEHLEEVLQLLTILTGDRRFEEAVYENNHLVSGGVNNMCDVLDRIVAKGKAEGKAEGEIIGAIKVYRDEMNLMPLEIIQKIEAKYALDKPTAAKYVEETLGLQPV